MPTLIVEDGSIVANANTYIDEAFLTSYAADRGFSIPATAEVQQQYILIAMDYLSWYTDVFQGSRTDVGSSLPWPRTGLLLDCIAFDKNTIPSQLKFAQAQLVVEQQKRTLLFPKPKTSTVEGLVTEKTIGPLTRKYSFNGKGVASDGVPIKIMAVEVFLKALFVKNASLRTIRV